MINNIVMPFVKYILAAELKFSTCVMTCTNDEACQVAGLLLRNGVSARLIQSNEGFSLYNLLEVRFFLSQLDLPDTEYRISEDAWTNARRQLINRFSNSPNLELCLNIIREFEITNPNNKYRSDLEIFIRESNMEDFITDKNDIIYVSTIHKTKGREFDNVFLMLNRFSDGTDEGKRQLYVALTRAKTNLVIHYNGRHFDGIHAENLIRLEDRAEYPPAPELAVQLTHKDIWLDFFQSCQYLVNQLDSDSELLININDYCCSNQRGQVVLRFSKRFQQRIENFNQQGYMPKSALVNYIVYWKKEDSNKEIKIILPKVIFVTENVI